MTSGRIVSYIVVTAPILIWCIHIFVLVPRLATLNGDAKWHAAMTCFALGTLIMIVCELLAVDRWRKSRDSMSLLAIFLNLTWLYYIKVFYLGPTIGDL